MEIKHVSGLIHDSDKLSITTDSYVYNILKMRNVRCMIKIDRETGDIVKIREFKYYSFDVDYNLVDLYNETNETETRVETLYGEQIVMIEVLRNGQRNHRENQIRNRVYYRNQKIYIRD